MEGVQLYYEDLEEAREPLRQKIWEYHLQIKNSKKEKKNTPSLIARFTILDSFRVDDDGYQIVGNFLNRRQQFIDDKQPFSDYVKIVDLRNDSLHYTLEFKPPVADLTPLYNSYRYENAELALKTINSMIEHLCENSNIQLPRWLMKFRSVSGYGDDAFS